MRKIASERLAQLPLPSPLGLNTLLVHLSVNSQKSYKAATPVSIHQHLSSYIIRPFSATLQCLKQHSSPPHCSSLPPLDNTKIAHYLDTLSSSLPLLLLLNHSLWAVARWLNQGLQLSLSAAKLPSIAHLLLVEGVESIGALREVLPLVGEVAAPGIRLPSYSPHWLMEEVQGESYTSVCRSLQWMEVRLSEE